MGPSEVVSGYFELSKFTCFVKSCHVTAQAVTRWVSYNENFGLVPAYLMWGSWWSKCQWSSFITQCLRFFHTNHSTTAPSSSINAPWGVR